MAVVSLPHCNGNYRGCIAELALDQDYGHHKGNTHNLVEHLEFVAKACANLGITGDSCLLRPVAARIGLAAISSQTGRSIYGAQIENALDSRYPEQLATYRVPPDARQPRGYRSDVASTDVPASDATPLSRRNWLRSSIIISAYGQPLSLSPLHVSTEGMVKLSRTEKTVLNISQILCSSLIKDKINDHERWRPAPARMSVQTAESGLTITESIDGLILSLRPSYRAQYSDPQAPPEDSITMEWPRDRVVHIASSEVI